MTCPLSYLSGLILRVILCPALPLSYLSPFGSADERVYGGDEREGDVRQLGVVLVSERVVQPPVQLLPERQQQLAEALQSGFLGRSAGRPQKKKKKGDAVGVGHSNEHLIYHGIRNT